MKEAIITILVICKSARDQYLFTEMDTSQYYEECFCNIVPDSAIMNELQNTCGYQHDYCINLLYTSSVGKTDVANQMYYEISYSNEIDVPAISKFLVAEWNKVLEEKLGKHIKSTKI